MAERVVGRRIPSADDPAVYRHRNEWLQSQHLDGEHDLGPGILQPAEYRHLPAVQYQRQSDCISPASLQLVRPRPDRADQIWRDRFPDTPLERSREPDARRPG